MDPNEDQLRQRLVDSAVSQPFSADGAQGGQVDTPPPILPDAPTVSDFGVEADRGFNSLMSAFNAESQPEAQGDDIQSRLLSLMQDVGQEDVRRTQLSQEAGLPDARQEIQDVVNELQSLQKQRSIIPLQLQQESQGRGRTRAGIEPLETGRLRENAIKTLASSAIGETLIGNYQIAQQNVEDALSAEFAPKKAEVDVLKQAYEFNRDELTRFDAKRADNMRLILAERERTIALDEANKKAKYDLGITAGQFGASSATVKKIFEADTPEQAAIAAGEYLRDPETVLALEERGVSIQVARQQLANALLNNKLTQLDIDKKQKEIALIGVPTQEEIQAEKEREKTAEGKAFNLKAKIDTFEALKTHPGMKGTVGVYAFSRATPFTLDKAAKNDFVVTVERLIAQEFLDTIISLKEQGGTLGALNESEGEQLRQAASNINGLRRKRDDGSIYYEGSEESFKKELDRLTILAKKAYTRAGYDMFNSEENDILDDLFETFSVNSSTSPTNFDPLTFYAN